MKPFFYDAITNHRGWALQLITADAAFLRQKRIEAIVDTTMPELDAHFCEYVHRVLSLPSDWSSLIGTTSYRQQFWETVASDIEFGQIVDLLHFEYCSLLNFELSGRKVFHIEAALLDRLVLTVADAPAALLRMPFRSFFFVLDAPSFYALFPTLLSAMAGREEPLSISISESDEADGKHLVFFVASVDPSSLKHSVVIKRSLLVRPDETVEDALRTVWPEKTMGAVADENFFTDETIAFFRTLLNCVLYISSRTADWVLEKPPGVELSPTRRQREFAKRIRKQHSHLPFFHVGGQITVAPFRDYVTSAGLQNIARCVLKKFLVRGHWRTQHYGSQSELTKLIFVEPYWKGPDIADIVSKPYSVEL